MTTLELESRTESGPARYRFRTRAGLHADDGFRPAELAVLEHCWDGALGETLVVQANYGVLGTVFGTRVPVTMTESSARAAKCCRSNLRANGVDGTVRLVARPAEVAERFDTAVYVPKPYTPVAMGKQRLADALTRLLPGGRLYVAGRTETGLSRYREYLSSLAPVDVVAERAGETVLRVERPDHVDATGVVDRRVQRASIDGVDLCLMTAPGLFSAGGLDDGTRLLIESLDVTTDDRVLDLCCGYGPVGAYAGCRGADTVVLSDDDARATRCARRTLAANDVDATVVTADCLAGVRDQRFDLVASNPPTHTGTDVLGALFDGTADVLTPGGRFVFVHHRRLDLSAHLDAFTTVERRATGPEHVVRVARH